MNTEIEVKILDINPKELHDKLTVLGAKRKEIFYKIQLYKIDDDTTPQKEFARLRDDGEKITLAYKKKHTSGISGTEEVELEVSNFDQAKLFLDKIELGHASFYQEKKRWLYELEGIEFAIDFWPLIKPFLEVEADNEANVKRGVEMLGLDSSNLSNPDITELFHREGLDIHHFNRLQFNQPNL